MKKFFIPYSLIVLYFFIIISIFIPIYISNISLPLFFLIFIYIFNLLFIIFIFLQKRHFSAKLSWIMLIIIIPIIGHLLFLIFGQRYQNITKIKKYQKYETFKHEKINFNKYNNDILFPYSKVSARGIYNANFKFYDSGNESFNALFKDLSNAKKHIHIHYYIVKPGEIYDTFKDILIKKANEGIEIRMIFDDFGQWKLPKHEINDFIKNGIHIQIFNKILFPFLNSYNNYRTHRKLAIIDSKITHIGGLNIGDEYASLSSKFGKWIDLHARIEGQAVKSHELLFIEDWKQITQEYLNPENYIFDSSIGDNKTVLLEDSPQIEDNILHDSLVDLILNAKKEILISTPYFVPSENIEHALKYASQKGVKIKIFVPGKHDHKISWVCSNYYIYKLMNSNIKFYRTKNIFLHTKAGIFDNKISYFGTPNIDKRSLYSQLETINIFYGNATKSLKLIFDDYEKISFQIKKNNNKNVIKNLLLKFFITIVSPLM